MGGKKQYKDLMQSLRANGEGYTTRHAPGHLKDFCYRMANLRSTTDVLAKRMLTRQRSKSTGSAVGLKNLIVLTTSDDVFVAWRQKFAA